MHGSPWAYGLDQAPVPPQRALHVHAGDARTAQADGQLGRGHNLSMRAADRGHDVHQGLRRRGTQRMPRESTGTHLIPGQTGNLGTSKHNAALEM
jgi:hypothetical protein